MVAAARDAAFMARALFLAERGRGQTTPNPIVGAVVTTPDGIVIGSGAHRRAGGPHAEVVALDAAGTRTRGGTLYCTLEPCVHHGRTGPCVERIVEAGIARVVAAVTDPNPRVSGHGFAYLRARGIEVVEGVERQAALAQHAPFFRWIRDHRPFVIAKMAVSKDGFAGRSGSRVELTGTTANRFFHRQRAEVDAIAVGSGTILADDPELTARGAFRVRPLTRVIFDWRGRVRGTARIFGTLAAGPIMVVTSEATRLTAPAHFDALAAAGVIIEALPDVDLAAALRRIATRDVVTLLAEGGPALHEALAEADLVDRVQRVTTPATLGEGVRASNHWRFSGPLEGLERSARTVQLGEDVLTEFDVHRID